MSPITWRRKAEPDPEPLAEATSPPAKPQLEPLGWWRAEQERYERARRAWRSKRTRERESPTSGLRDREF